MAEGGRASRQERIRARWPAGSGPPWRAGSSVPVSQLGSAPPGSFAQTTGAGPLPPAAVEVELQPDGADRRERALGLRPSWRESLEGEGGAARPWHGPRPPCGGVATDRPERCRAPSRTSRVPWHSAGQIRWRAGEGIRRFQDRKAARSAGARKPPASRRRSTRPRLPSVYGRGQSSSPPAAWSRSSSESSRSLSRISLISARVRW